MEERRLAVERMYRARLSWTLLGGIGLLGLTGGLGTGLRGLLFGVGIAAFVWLNQPLVSWLLRARAAGDSRWQPAAAGLVLRVVGLVAVVAASW